MCWAWKFQNAAWGKHQQFICPSNINTSGNSYIYSSISWESNNTRVIESQQILEKNVRIPSFQLRLFIIYLFTPVDPYPNKILFPSPDRSPLALTISTWIRRPILSSRSIDILSQPQWRGRENSTPEPFFGLRITWSRWEFFIEYEFNLTYTYQAR